MGISGWKKHGDVKTTSLYNKRNPTNINAQKHKKAQNELINVYLKEQTSQIRSVRLVTRLKIYNQGEHGREKWRIKYNV